MNTADNFLPIDDTKQSWEKVMTFFFYVNCIYIVYIYEIKKSNNLMLDSPSGHSFAFLRHKEEIKNLQNSKIKVLRNRI